MVQKRRNNGRCMHNRGHTKTVRCSNCGRVVAKDKAVRRFMVRNIVDASSMRDIKENSAFEDFTVPKFFIKLQYCISCSIHSRIVRVRRAEERRNRAPPAKPRQREEDKKKAPKTGQQQGQQQAAV